MSLNSEHSSNQINNSTFKQVLENRLSIEDLNASLKNNMSFENNDNSDNKENEDNIHKHNSQSLSQSPLQSQSQSQSQFLYQYNDIIRANANLQIEKLNSNAITTYVTSLNKMIHNLNIENEELKVNFVQVSEMLQSERESNQSTLSKQQAQYQSEIKLLQTSNEIFQKEKQRHLEQNSIEKEQYEMQLSNYKQENEQLIARIKKLKEENELLRKENFDVNMRLMEANKLQYENESLKEAIKQMSSSHIDRNSNGCIVEGNDNQRKGNRINNNNKKERSKSNDRVAANKMKTKVKAKAQLNTNTNNIVIKNNKSNLNKVNDLRDKEKKLQGDSICNYNSNENKAVSKGNHKFQMTPYERISLQSNSFKEMPLDNDIENYNENVRRLKTVYNEYVLKLNSKAYKSIEEEEDLKKKIKMIMETIESQKGNPNKA